MDALEFRDYDVVLIEDAFGGLSTSEFAIPYENLEDYEIRIDVSGEVRLDELISVANGDNPRLNLLTTLAGSVEVKHRPANHSDEDSPAGNSIPEIGEDPSSGNAPPIPEVSNFKDKTRAQFYHRLKDNPDSQPAIMRRYIRKEGEITKRQLGSQMTRHGYVPSAGSFNACLLVLDEVTDEIERHGRGDDQRIVWTGE